MTGHANAVRLLLNQGPSTAQNLAQRLGISQPTVSRALGALGPEVVRLGRARSMQYALRDSIRGLGNIPVYRIGVGGTLNALGVLVPVRPDGFVMQQADGRALYSEGLPWWLVDMRPQGFLGRAYAQQYSATLGLPPQVAHWSDTQALQALLAHGADAVGNLLLGDRARERFLAQAALAPIAPTEKGPQYADLAERALQAGGTWSSAGGEQPKFCAYAQTDQGPAHVLVKFAGAEANPVTQRWRDLLLAEHIALCTLADGGVPAAQSTVSDHAGQRFLEVLRFDRVGSLGRRGLVSLSAMDPEFVGQPRAIWPIVVAELAHKGIVTPQAAQQSALLHAFGTLIGNDDMHHGNLSFLIDEGRPYGLAPAYDVLPMAFRPRSGGSLPAQLVEAHLHPAVANRTWLQAGVLTQTYVQRLQAEARFSTDFQPCIAALAQHLERAAAALGRLARE